MSTKILGSRISINIRISDMHFYDPILIIFQIIVVILAKNEEYASTKTCLLWKMDIDEDGMLICFRTIIGIWKEILLIQTKSNLQTVMKPLITDKNIKMQTSVSS